MYYVFDAIYGILRQIQSSEFGPTSTPTPSQTPSFTPSPSKTPTHTSSPSPSPTYGSKTVTTLVGGGADPSDRAANFGYVDAIGTNARFDSVRGLTYATVAGAPTLFLADTLNSVIRRVDLGTLAVTSFAGKAWTGLPTGTNPRCGAQVGGTWAVNGVGTAAVFCQPTQVKESGGFLYVADTWDMCIRKVDIATAAVTTFVGNSVAGTTGCDTDGTGTNARFLVSSAPNPPPSALPE